MNNPESIKNRLRLNNQDYEVSVVLYNTQGNAFPINASSILSLVIVESTHTWFKTGHIILQNGYNVLEKRANEFMPEDAFYKFRGDGRDLLFVNIKPVVTTNNEIEEEAFEPQYWEMRYVFTVYDTEDIPGNSVREKNIKLYFWETDYQICTETNLNWSTNDVLYELYPEYLGRSSQLSDYDRKVPTGLALQSLIYNALNDKVQPQKFSDEWDIGSSNIFYTPSTSSVVALDIDYLVKRHVCSEREGVEAGDTPILFRDRYDKTWNLLPLSKFLSKAVNNQKEAGPYQLEQFYIANSEANSVIIPSLPYTPQDPTGKRNITLGQLSTISNYQFVNMSAVDNTNILVNTPCFANDLGKKQFNMDLADNTVESIKDYFQKNYANKFKFNSNPTPLLTLNKTKTQSVAVNTVYSYGANKLERYTQARNSILESSLFLNECLTFTVNGSTFRQVNKFIGLDRANGNIDSDFDEKFLGQWLVTRVVHQFTQTGYTNTITAVKPYASKNLRIDDAVD